MKHPLLAAFVLTLIALPPLAHAQSTLPNPRLTPGATNPAVTEATIGDTICQRGWTATVRPPVSYTEPLKKQQLRTDGYTDRKPWHYEEDHLIPLALGGSPTDPRNLWPEPHLGPHQWGSYAKDRLEARLARMVCRHRIPLARAQDMIAGNWIAAYRQVIGPEPDNRPRHRRHHGWN
ncbi:MAG TPA: hypothetical protein VF286_12520 [Acidiphilium sp.]